MHIIVYRYGKKYQKYVKFFWGSKLYMYNACPMGLCTSPRLCFNQFFSSPRRNGHQPVIYIDDTYLQGETVDACNQNVMATIEMLSNFGFVINSEKSVFYATQKLEFLGFFLNSIEMTVTLTEHIGEKLKSVCSEFLNSKNKKKKRLCVDWEFSSKFSSSSLWTIIL